MYNKMDIRELAEELERQKSTKVDITMSSENMRAVVGDNNVALELNLATMNDAQLEMIHNAIPPGNRKLIEGMGETPFIELGLNNWAHSQMADKCKIPKKYYDRMQESGLHELTAQNINAWIRDKEKRLVQVLDGQARAILSDRYRTIDNFDVVEIALDNLMQYKDAGVHIVRCDLSDTKMYIKAILQGIEGEIKVGDPVQQGLIISNSEVGSGSFKVEPFLWRLTCSNGMISESALTKIHLGAARDGVQIYSDMTKQLQDETLISEIRDVIGATFDRTVFDAWMADLQQATEVKIAQPTIAVDNVVAHFDLGEEKKKSILDFFTAGEDASQYGLINAITRTAQDEANYEKQIDLERLGGTLSHMDVNEFNDVVKVVA